ncbi:TPA: DUF4116 domain-containing protein [Clostridioides difficile]|uniref:DUF4116 domain-containing protein n=1 Tax=Clostridioides difficile TaxID=1496 RepID=UPI00016C686E|nr:DUF4116 domain-containing protein [Clostridioides difficile]MBG0198929.1 DUF4116 domain-containing protein [Clostridioides difficile]MCA0574535.1 DUF4116 domain-containing protein [Clostridioides difficile]HBE8979618.1 DUF4116 domain-containing protein [Clostridioides difficile]HBF2384669.1 DUF4116 domain-containing protein [Clostridioides difficile]HBF2825546.1 DUF4116 domain-containing protein [Clostridioides difficile]
MRELALEKVKENGYNLIYINEQDYEICLEAIKNNGKAIQLVKWRILPLTKEEFYNIYKEAVRQNGYSALHHIKWNELNLIKADINDLYLDIVREDGLILYR